MKTIKFEIYKIKKKLNFILEKKNKEILKKIKKYSKIKKVEGKICGTIKETYVKKIFFGSIFYHFFTFFFFLVFVYFNLKQKKKGKKIKPKKNFFTILSN